MPYLSPALISTEIPFRKKADPLSTLVSGILISTGANLVLGGAVLAQEGEFEEIVVQDTRGGA